MGHENPHLGYIGLGGLRSLHRVVGTVTGEKYLDLLKKNSWAASLAENATLAAGQRPSPRGEERCRLA